MTPNPHATANNPKEPATYKAVEWYEIVEYVGTLMATPTIIMTGTPTANPPIKKTTSDPFFDGVGGE